MKIIFISQPIIGRGEIEEVKRVLKSNILARGPKIKELEKKFANYCNRKYAIAVCNGTAALHTGLYGLNIKQGDEVITTPFTFVSTANAIIMQGAKVVFADIDNRDFNLSPQSVARMITKKTKAIIPVDLYGQIYNHKAIQEIARKYNLKILEDACQAIGAEQNDKRAGSFGDVAAFSFYATKNITCGEGGILVTDNYDISERCRRFINHGQSLNNYEYSNFGYNYRMSEIHAAIAIEQLKKAQKFNKKRIDNANKLIKGLWGIKGLILPTVKYGNKHVFHQFTIRITNEFKTSRDKFIKFLRKNRIGCGIYYPTPLHLNPYFIRLGYKEGNFPVAEKLSQQVLSLPVHPTLTNKDIGYIIKIIKSF